MKKRIIALGCDEAAFGMKEALKALLQEQQFEVVDYGVGSVLDTTPYPDVAYKVATEVQRNDVMLAILCCGTGIGMAITANKVDGIRAAQAHDTYSAQRARKSNNAQILTIGARVVGLELAKDIAMAFVNSDFEPARSGAKVDRIMHYERLRSTDDRSAD